MSNLRVDIVDLSQYQNADSVPWAALVRFGVKAVYAKATEGFYKDPEYPRHRAAAKLHGLVFGAYSFAHTDKDPVASAEFFLNYAQPAPRDGRPMLDLEQNQAGLGIVALTQWRDHFLSTIGAHLHISYNLLYSQFEFITTGNNLLWRAAYSGTPDHNGNWYVPKPQKPFTKIDLWQFSDGVWGSPNEVGGDHVDLSTFLGSTTLEQIRIPAPAKPGQATTVKVDKKTNTVAVVPGKWAPWNQRILFHGVTLNQMTAHALLEVEQMVGRQFVFYRGSYTNGTTSAGTDSMGGHADISLQGIDDAEAERIVKALRIKGFAAYFRHAIPGYWPRHIHVILIGDPDISAPAAKQVVEYKQGRNALANNGPDTEWRPKVIKPYAYPPTAARIAQDKADYALVA